MKNIVQPRKKVFIIILIGLLVLLYKLPSWLYDEKQDPVCQNLYFAQAEDTTFVIRPFATKDQYIVALPAHWINDKLLVRFDNNSGLVKVGETSIGKNFVHFENIENQYKISGGLSWLKGGKAKISFVPIHSNTILILTETGNLDHILKNKANSEAGMIKVINEQGETEYEGALSQIHGRGNHTWSMPKKPFSIKLDKTSKILGLRKDKSFNLLNNYVDPSYMRSWMALSFEEQIKMPNHPKCTFTQLFVNGEFLGLYLITNKINVGKHCIDIIDLDKENEKINEGKNVKDFRHISIDDEDKKNIFKAYDAPNNPEDISGGYLFEANCRYACYADDECGFKSNSGLYITMRTPKYATTEQVSYIQNLYNEIDAALIAPDGRHPQTGKHYSEYIDVKSYVRHYLINELFFNTHGDNSSLKQYKNSDNVDSLVHVAAAWDFDKSLGGHGHLMSKNPNVLFGLATCQEDTMYTSFVCKLEKRPEFFALAKEIYVSEFADAVQNWLSSEMLDSIHNHIEKDILVDCLRWKKKGNVSANYDKTKDFCLRHAQLLDKVFAENAYYENCKVHLHFNVEDLGHSILYLIPRGSRFPVEELFDRSLMGNGGGDIICIINRETNQEFDATQPIESDLILDIKVKEMNYWERLKRKIRVTISQ